MYKNNKILAFIGARGGSKGLVDKNVSLLAGKSLILWTIEASNGSKYIDRTIVSTEDEEIAKVAKQSGADVPFLRPKEFAADESIIDDSIVHCVNWLSENENESYDYIMLLQPTSPMRTNEHIDQSIEFYFENKSNETDMLMSVVTLHQKSGWIMQMVESGYIEFCLDLTKERRNRQKNPNFYLPNGAIYFGPTKNMEELSSTTAKTMPFIMSQESSIDIDSKEDLKEAQKILESLSDKNERNKG